MLLDGLAPGWGRIVGCDLGEVTDGVVDGAFNGESFAPFVGEGVDIGDPVDFCGVAGHVVVGGDDGGAFFGGGFSEVVAVVFVVVELEPVFDGDGVGTVWDCGDGLFVDLSVCVEFDDEFVDVVGFVEAEPAFGGAFEAVAECCVAFVVVVAV